MTPSTSCRARAGSNVSPRSRVTSTSSAQLPLARDVRRRSEMMPPSTPTGRDSRASAARPATRCRSSAPRSATRPTTRAASSGPAASGSTRSRDLRLWAFNMAGDPANGPTADGHGGRRRLAQGAPCRRGQALAGRRPGRHPAHGRGRDRSAGGRRRRAPGSRGVADPAVRRPLRLGTNLVEADRARVALRHLRGHPRPSRRVRASSGAPTSSRSTARSRRWPRRPRASRSRPREASATSS